MKKLTTDELFATAFPVKKDINNEQHDGLCKREFFAAFAMVTLGINRKIESRTDAHDLAQDAFNLADHMLDESDRYEDQQGVWEYSDTKKFGHVPMPSKDPLRKQ
jgi:hypothetical protein